MTTHIRSTLLAMVFAFAAGVADFAHAQLTAQVLPERSSFQEVFAASHKFYPGQRLVLRVDGQIDANHRYWRDRECSWFGLKCKWVNREASNLMGVDRLPLLLSLEPVPLLVRPPHVNQPQWFRNPAAQHLAVSPNGQYDVLVEVANAGASVEAFSTAVVMRGVVADQYDASAAINRGQCHNRPPVCSSGAYKVTVVVDNRQRVQLLQQLLGSRRTSAEILSRQVMDPLFIQDALVKPAIAEELFKHARQFHKDKTDEARRQYLAILSFASSLNPSRADILNEIAATHLELGEFTAAAATIKEGLATAKARYDSENPRRAATVIDMSTAVMLKGSTWARERAGMVGTDLMVAVGLYREAAKYCSDEVQNYSAASDKQLLYSCAKDRLIDAGRTVAMLRSRDSLMLAEQLLTDAQNAARLAVDVSQP